MTTIDDVREAARQLSPIEQLLLIQDLLRLLQQDYPAVEEPHRQNPTPALACVAGLDQGSYWVSDDFDAELSDEFWLGDADEPVA